VLMLGNSSSGIVEAGLFGLPVIDVGGRQAGRARGENVRHCGANAGSIVGLMADADSAPVAPRAARASFYGDGHAAPRIAAVVKNMPARDRLLVKRYSEQSTQFEPPWAENAASELLATL